MLDLEERLARAQAMCKRKIKHALENAVDQESCETQLFEAAEEYAGACASIEEAKLLRRKRTRTQNPDLG
jgi:hypothetical protein